MDKSRYVARVRRRQEPIRMLLLTVASAGLLAALAVIVALLSSA